MIEFLMRFTKKNIQDMQTLGTMPFWVFSGKVEKICRVNLLKLTKININI